jgi:hypothetical protein
MRETRNLRTEKDKKNEGKLERGRKRNDNRPTFT